jgi:hypothetical protein
MLPILLLKTTTFFAATGCTLPKTTFLFLPPWWEYIPSGSVDPLGQCSPNFVFPGDIWLVGLAVLDMLLRLAGFAAVISIIIAGFQYQFTGGSADKAAAARRRIINSLLGLAIALIAAAIVTFVGNQLAK